MGKVVCSKCDARLKLPDGFDKSSVRCPRCGTRNPVVPGSDTANPTSGAESAESGPDPGPVAGETWVVDTPESGTTAKTGKAWRKRTGILAALLDVRFKHYLTPKLIQWSWLLVLILSAVWLAFLVLVFAVSFFPDGSSAEESTSPPHFGQPLDIDSLLDGQGNGLSGISELLAGSLAGASQEPTLLQRITGFGWRALFLITSLAGLVLTLLGCRVMLETIMVIFDINDSLKRMEAK